MSAPPPLPNPETPLAFLPKTVADQYEVSRYIYVASLGAFIWDILTHLPEEYRLLFKHRITLATLVYFFSRIASLAYIITSTIFQIGTVPSCQALQVALGWCFVAAVSSSSFLFFLRVRAIFERNKLVIAFFAIMWLGVLGGTITVPFAIEGGHIGTTRYCINTSVKPYSSAGIIISSVNDFFVLFAISWRIVTAMAIDDSLKGRVRSFFGQGRLPDLSRAILQSGQQYYAITVGSNILTMIMILTPSVPPVYHAMFTIPNVGLMNSMACRVFRNIKFGLMDSVPTTTFRSTNNSGTLPVAFNGRRPRPAPTDTTFTLGDGIEVSKSVQHIHDPIPMEVRLQHAKSFES